MNSDRWQMFASLSEYIGARCLKGSSMGSIELLIDHDFHFREG